MRQKFIERESKIRRVLNKIKGITNIFIIDTGGRGRGLETHDCFCAYWK